MKRIQRFPYAGAAPESLILRDHLAYDRTILANERTLLAYLRTAIAFMAGGGMLLKVFPANPALLMLGVALLALGGLTALFGVWRCAVVGRRLAQVYLPPAEPPEKETDRQ